MAAPAPPRAWLGGVPLANAGSVSWAEVAGIVAPTVVWTVHEKQWERLKELQGVPLTLRVAPAEGKGVEWQGLYVLREAPSTLPFHRAFVVSDVRWKWPRVLVSRSFNIPRKTGNRRMVGEGPVELQQVVDSYGYAFTSLNDARKWTARDFVAAVVRRVAEQCAHKWIVESFPLTETRQVTVEGLDMGEGGDTAIGHALRHAPGSEITIDRFGRAVVFDATKRSDVQARLEGVPRTAAGGIDRLVDLSAIRPSHIVAYFQREVELRFDSVDEDETTVQTYRDPAENSQMTMENVIPTVDPVTTIDGQQVALGTYVALKKFLAACNEDLASIGSGYTPPALTIENVRKYWFVLEALYTPLGQLSLSAAQSNWVARIAAIRTHFRQTYKIPTSWMQRTRDLAAVRVGILDYVTATRNPSRAWSQFAIEPTPKAHFIGRLASKQDQWYWLNVDNYPGIDGELHDNSSSPAVVQVVDKDLGILHVNYRMDPHGMRSAIHPSMMREGGSGKVQAPTGSLSKRSRDVLCVNGRVTGAAPIALSNGFRIAVVFTATPFAPNDERRLFGYVVKPEDVDPFLSEQFTVTGGKGPPFHVLCPPNLMTAKYAIRKSAAARDGARMLFGFDDGLPEPGANSPEEAPGYHIINVGGEDGLLDAVARAIACAQWAAFTNQVEGSVALHLRPDLDLRGSMQSVRHRLDPDGRLVTEVAMQSERRPMDPFAMIPQALRTQILGLVGGGVA